MPLNLMDLLTPGRPGGAVGNPLDAKASGGGSLQLDKSIRVRPGGGGAYPDIPAAVVLGEVMPLEEAVAPYPGDWSTTWLHDWGELDGRLPCRCTWILGGSSSGKIPNLLFFPAAGVGLQLGGSYHCPD